MIERIHTRDAARYMQGADATRALHAYLTGRPVEKAKPKAPLTKAGFIEFVIALAAALQSIVQAPEEQARVDAMAEIPDRWDNLTDAQRQQIYDRFGAALGSVAQSVNPKIAAEIRKQSGQMVASTREVMIGQYGLPIAGRLSQIDERILDHAAKSQSSYVTDEYGKRQAAASVQARTIVEKSLRDGVDYIEIGKRMENVLTTQLNRTPNYFTSVASIHAARSRTWGQLSALDEAGTERYQLEATLDEATCFAAGTPVLMADGSTKAIDTIVAGDVVVSSSGTPRRVTGTKISTAKKWFSIVLDSGVRIIATKDHPFLTRIGWVRAESLRSGDALVRYVPSGPGAASSLWGNDEVAWQARRGRREPRTLHLAPWPRHDLAKVSLVMSTITLFEQMPIAPANAYDIEVEHDHGFVVGGSDGVIVHNSAVCRLMHGKTFELSAAIKRHMDVEAGEPEDVKQLMPFVGHGKDDNGEFLYVKDGDKRVRIAEVMDSGVGRKDDTGKFSGVMSERDLAARGVIVPPFHGRCRTLILPVF